MPAEKMHKDEVDTDAASLGRLLANQFPQWADLPIEPVAWSGGERTADGSTACLSETKMAREPRDLRAALECALRESVSEAMKRSVLQRRPNSLNACTGHRGAAKVAVDKRMGELPVPTAELEAVRLEVFAAPVVLAQCLPLCYEPTDRSL